MWIMRRDGLPFNLHLMKIINGATSRFGAAPGRERHQRTKQVHRLWSAPRLSTRHLSRAIWHELLAPNARAVPQSDLVAHQPVLANRSDRTEGAGPPGPTPSSAR